jgi:hypothetical protein
MLTTLKIYIPLWKDYNIASFLLFAISQQFTFHYGKIITPKSQGFRNSFASIYIPLWKDYNPDCPNPKTKTCQDLHSIMERL